MRKCIREHCNRLRDGSRFYCPEHKLMANLRDLRTWFQI